MSLPERASTRPRRGRGFFVASAAPSFLVLLFGAACVFGTPDKAAACDFISPSDCAGVFAFPGVISGTVATGISVCSSDVLPSWVVESETSDGGQITLLSQNQRYFARVATIGCGQYLLIQCGEPDGQLNTCAFPDDGGVVSLSQNREIDGFPQVWAGDEYDDFAPMTIARKGCALTSLAMAVNFVSSRPFVDGQFLDPGLLNTFLSQRHDFNGDHNILWEDAVTKVGDQVGMKLRFVGKHFDSDLTSDLDAELALGYPVIVGVRIALDSQSKRIPHHYVLVTSRTVDGDYAIIDPNVLPDGTRRTSLADYDDAFLIRGHVEDPVEPMLYIYADSNARPLLVDAAGRRTGAVSAGEVNEIPGAVFSGDALDDDLTGEGALTISYAVHVSTSTDSEYTLTFLRDSDGPFAFVVGGINAYGTQFPLTTVNGAVHGGTATQFKIDLVGGLDVTPLAMDDRPPAMAATVTPLPNEQGWNMTRPSVELTAVDELGGSGVRSISFYATGATPIAPTTARSTTVTVPIFGEGITTLHFAAADNAGNVETEKEVVVRFDQTPPEIGCSASPESIWPPNDKPKPVSVQLEVTDRLSGVASVRLVDIRTNEGTVVGSVQGFDVGKDSRAGLVLAHRSGAGLGRQYQFVYEGADRAGNTSKCVATATVQHDMRR